MAKRGPGGGGGGGRMPQILLDHADELGLTADQKAKLQDMAKGPMSVLTEEQKTKAKDLMPKGPRETGRRTEEKRRRRRSEERRRLAKERRRRRCQAGREEVDLICAGICTAGKKVFEYRRLQLSKVFQNNGSGIMKRAGY